MSAPQVFPGDATFPSHPSQDLPSHPRLPSALLLPFLGKHSHLQLPQPEAPSAPRPASPAHSLSPELQGPFLAFPRHLKLNSAQSVSSPSHLLLLIRSPTQGGAPPPIRPTNSEVILRSRQPRFSDSSATFRLYDLGPRFPRLQNGIIA